MARPYLPTPKIIHLSMDFFPPPTGRIHCLEGFLAHLPTGTGKRGPKPPQTLRCFFSETTSHSMLTVKASRKLPKRFLWEGRTVELDSPFVYRDDQNYFFTSALGDVLEEDRDKKNPCTPQLVAHGLMDLHFMVVNEEEGGEKAPGVEKSYHYFHMPDVVLVTEFFGPGSGPSIITPAEKRRMDERKIMDEKKRMDEKERNDKKEKAEVVEGGEKGEEKGEIKEKEGEIKEKEGEIKEKEGETKEREGEIKEEEKEKGKEKEINGGPEESEEDPDREGFELCLGQDFFQMYPHLMFSIVATPALEQRISSVHFGQSTTQLTYEGRSLSICAVGTCVGRDSGGGKLVLENGFAVHFAPQSVYNTYHRLPNLRQRRMKAPKKVDLKLRHLQAMVKDTKRGNLGHVKFVRGEEKQLEAAMNLATLSTCMIPFKAGPGSFEESRMASGTEHPLSIGEWGIDSDNDPGLDPEKYFISVEEPKENPQDDSLEAPGTLNPGPTLERSEDGTFIIPESMIVKRSPMFLNFGNTTTYVVRGKPIAYTERQLFTIDRDIDITAPLSSEMEEEA
ncbi:uncharacterized protein H6S33_006859 [Morchella sextelata]|uniref:uncharacterized protein n=1 Tax=Morchella sextelata TaxID=1174677 RepID=UPI001D035FD2|nr:uncharacterized protein H6S33_006859 [Morchella sextelata]KAH0604482.1 hypothetical protein H6S33_006859 [Morchella sextelata]